MVERGGLLCVTHNGCVQQPGSEAEARGLSDEDAKQRKRWAHKQCDALIDNANKRARKSSRRGWGARPRDAAQLTLLTLYSKHGVPTAREKTEPPREAPIKGCTRWGLMDQTGNGRTLNGE